jgi:peptidyl-prolyl cis-trans isomerase D
VFAKQVLAPRLTVQDFERYIRHELGIQQLIAVTGVSGELVTPQEVRALYARENEELSVQAVFFPASNYLANVAVTPEAILQFYTNQMPRYRLPERLQLSYVKFLATNFWEEAVKEINQITNLNEKLDQMYEERKTNLVNATTSPEEFKQNMLKEEQRKLALFKARKQANAFATELFDMSPVQADNVEKLAKAKGLTVEVTQPFSREEGPAELQVGEDFAEKAFKLTTTDPFAGEAVLGFDEAYVIALKARLPSENPPYESVRERATEDYRFLEAVRAARKAGQEFHTALTNGLAAGKGFVAICTEAKLQPVLPPPFSLSTQELPEIEKHVNLQQFKQVAFTSSIGKPSEFMPTREGGFVMVVQAKLPLDMTKMNAALTNFTRAVRQARQNEAFNDWFQMEAKRGLSEIPYFSRQQQQPQGAGMPPMPQ